MKHYSKKTGKCYYVVRCLYLKVVKSINICIQCPKFDFLFPNTAYIRKDYHISWGLKL